MSALVQGRTSFQDQICSSFQSGSHLFLERSWTPPDTAPPRPHHFHHLRLEREIHSGLTVDVFSLHQRAGEGEVHLLDEATSSLFSESTKK